MCEVLQPAGAGRRRLLGLAFWSAVAGGCALVRPRPEPPVVTLRAIVPETLDASGQTFLCRFLLENPNERDLDVVGGQVTLELDGFSAARGQTTTRFTIPALGFTQADIRVKLDLLSMAPGALQWLARGDPRLDYRLRGYVDLDVPELGRVPLRASGQVGLERLYRQLPGLLRRLPPSPPPV